MLVEIFQQFFVKIFETWRIWSIFSKNPHFSPNFSKHFDFRRNLQKILILVEIFVKF